MKIIKDEGFELIKTRTKLLTLEEAQTLDPNVFYYITDTTSNYVTNSSLNSSLPFSENIMLFSILYLVRSAKFSA